MPVIKRLTFTFLRRLSLACLVQYVAIPAGLHAELIAYEFTGSVIETEQVFGLHPPIGAKVSGRFSYDTTLPAVLFLPNTLAIYDVPSSHEFIVDIDGHMIEDGTQTSISVHEGAFPFGPGDNLEIISGGVAIDGVARPDAFSQLRFVSNSLGIFSNLQLPRTISLTDFDFTQYGQVFRGDSSIQENIAFSIDSLTFIPTPAACNLLAVALATILLTYVRHFRISDEQQMRL